ncbi:MAG: VRR-NUC domain-containing protein [Oscillospiraceae bacterium]|nr:VRR-NUC domain-containing protein [Oscillospiraceae bacterium]
MSEKQIEKKMCDLIKSRGGLSYKFVSPNDPGVPDRIVITPQGVVWFVELKTEIGGARRLQKWQIERLSATGANVRLLKGWEQVAQFVDEVMPYGA